MWFREKGRMRRDTEKLEPAFGRSSLENSILPKIKTDKPVEYPMLVILFSFIINIHRFKVHRMLKN